VAASILQETFAENTAGATSLAKAFTSNITAGSSIHAVGVAYADSATNTFSDGHNTYTSNLDHQTDGSNGIAQGFALNATGVATTVTYTVSPSQGLGLLIREVGGCSTSAIDAHTGAFVASGSQPSVNLTLVAAGALISAVCAELGAGSSVVAGSGYTSGQSNVWLDNNGTKTGTSESQHFATSGSKAVTFTDGSTGGMLVAMSFADLAGAAFPVGQICI
jgi:uncharacterized phage infection (PIP) family protein YhgE